MVALTVMPRLKQWIVPGRQWRRSAQWSANGGIGGWPTVGQLMAPKDTPDALTA
ncbi:hypothetical protein P3T25_004713 [Paraburkholderia sp. GAS32]